MIFWWFVISAGFYLFVKTNQEKFFKTYQQRVEFLFDLDEIMFHEKCLLEKKRVEFLNLRRFYEETLYGLYEIFIFST